MSAICVDPSPTRPPLPPWLKSVPTLLVIGEDAPRVGPGAVTNWLFEQKMGSGGEVKPPSNPYEDRRVPLAAPVYNPDSAPRPTPSAAATATATATSGKLPAAVSSNTPAEKGVGPPVLSGSLSEGPEAYHEIEMSGGNWSDSYSFLQHNDYTAEKGFDPISRNFEALVNVDMFGKIAKHGVGGASPPPQPKRSAKEDALLRDFEAYTAGRDRDITGPIARR